ncbi:nuclear RNA export factor 2-like [Ctenodactylus gundi]
MRGRGSSRSHRGRNYQHRSGSYERTPSHHHRYSGTVELRTVYENPSAKYTPYTQHSRQRNRQSVGDQVPATMSIGTRPQETGWKENTKDEPTERWFKITIPHGRNYEKAWLLNSIQRCCSVPFTPVDFHGAGNRALFFVQDESAASALKELSFKIRDRKNRPCMLTPEQMEQLEVMKIQSTLCAHFLSITHLPLHPDVPVATTFVASEPHSPFLPLQMVMKKRYSDCQKSLNLQKIRFDPDLLSHRIDMILNRRNCILAVLQIIEKNYPTLLSLNLRSNRLYQLDGLSGIVEKAPEIKILNLCKNELKSVWELKKVAGLKLEELWLKGNPVCQKFLDQSFYVGISAISLYPVTICFQWPSFYILLPAYLNPTSLTALPQHPGRQKDVLVLAWPGCAPMNAGHSVWQQIPGVPLQSLPEPSMGTQRKSRDNEQKKILEPELQVTSFGCVKGSNSNVGRSSPLQEEGGGREQQADGWELFPRIAAEIAPPKAVNPFQESCPGFEPIKAEILRFLEQYYLIYDYGDRKGLFGAYRDDAYFSLTVLSTQENPDSDSYCEFFKYSRNLLTLRDPNLRWQLLKFTKHDIMEFFGVLPKTEHNFSSIVVDVWLYMVSISFLLATRQKIGDKRLGRIPNLCILPFQDSMVYFSVHGVFKELEGNFERCVHAFTRTCIASPDSDSCLRLVNDQLFVRNASPEEIQHAFPVPIATSSPDSTSELSEKQQKIVKAFSIQSGMNLTWSQKCLEDNQWDYSRAASIFTVLQNQGMIPQEAFKKMG